jgi:hypothetical protein
VRRRQSHRMGRTGRVISGSEAAAKTLGWGLTGGEPGTSRCTELWQRRCVSKARGVQHWVLVGQEDAKVWALSRKARCQEEGARKGHEGGQPWRRLRTKKGAGAGKRAASSALVVRSGETTRKVCMRCCRPAVDEPAADTGLTWGAPPHTLIKCARQRQVAGGTRLPAN